MDTCQRGYLNKVQTTQAGRLCACSSRRNHAFYAENVLYRQRFVVMSRASTRIGAHWLPFIGSWGARRAGRYCDFGCCGGAHLLLQTLPVVIWWSAPIDRISSLPHAERRKEAHYSKYSIQAHTWDTEKCACNVIMPVTRTRVTGTYVPVTRESQNFALRVRSLRLPCR